MESRGSTPGSNNPVLPPGRNRIAVSGKTRFALQVFAAQPQILAGIRGRFPSSCQPQASGACQTLLHNTRLVVSSFHNSLEMNKLATIVAGTPPGLLRGFNGFCTTAFQQCLNSAKAVKPLPQGQGRKECGKHIKQLRRVPS
ncbi:hypothetical protein ETAA8_06100 [Anatilimnocola aggregata]|uniref:Uncharacterized protein n=1 Tax=Anatilimnocola aggregata TaxID=2528021 RepID=A0A517Y5N1_9BACT|nr:hypothetical protein ETAA8_06100 [Anatilimnocola aggregata]